MLSKGGGHWSNICLESSRDPVRRDVGDSQWREDRALWSHGGGHYHHPLGTLVTPSTGPQHPKGGKASHASVSEVHDHENWVDFLKVGLHTRTMQDSHSPAHGCISTGVSLHHRRITPILIFGGGKEPEARTLKVITRKQYYSLRKQLCSKGGALSKEKLLNRKTNTKEQKQGYSMLCVWRGEKEADVDRAQS